MMDLSSGFGTSTSANNKSACGDIHFHGFMNFCHFPCELKIILVLAFLV